VKACNDAHIALMAHDNDAKSLYEIVIGGWKNTRSVIRRSRQGRAFGIAKGKYLSCNSFKKFRVCYRRNVISVSKPYAGGWKIFLSYNDLKPYPIRFVGVSTALWAKGDWMVKQPGEFLISFFLYSFGSIRHGQND